MQRMGATLAITVVTLVGILVTSPCGATELRVSFSIAEDGTVVADAPAVAPDPPNCLGPLSPVGLALTLQNTSPAPTNFTETVVLSGAVHFPPGSTCTASVGTCTIIDPLTLQWSGTIPPFSTAFANAVAQVDAQTPAGSQLCATATVVIDSNPPRTITVCTATNSDNQCGLRAPALSETSIALLMLALGAGGMLLLSRRRS